MFTLDWVSVWLLTFYKGMKRLCHYGESLKSIFTLLLKVCNTFHNQGSFNFVTQINTQYFLTVYFPCTEICYKHV